MQETVSEQHQSAVLRIDMAAYTLITSALRMDYPNRLYLATVAGYMANVGPEVKRIADAMGKSQPFVRKCIRQVEKLLRDEYIVG